MPNWCDCSLSITGDKKQIAELKAKAPKKEAKKDFNGKVIKYKGKIDYAKTDFSIENFIPIPKALQGSYSPLRKIEKETEEEYKKRMADNVKKYGARDWYDWSLQNWGTKWDIEADLVDDSEEHLSYSFPSAWSPPLEGIRQISLQFPKLTFMLEYEESGNCFSGSATIKNGVTDDFCEDIKYDELLVCQDCGEHSIRTNTDKAGECEYCGEGVQGVLPKIKCPLCEEEIEYKVFNDVHYWSCPACPFVGMEYYNNKNLDELKKALK